MGRTSDTRERLIQTGCELMARRGYSGLGVAEICGHSGVPKGSFYYFFESKQALALAVIDEQWRAQRATWLSVLEGAATPLHRLEALFRVTAEVQEEVRRTTGSMNGCLFANLALELSTQDDIIRARLGQIFAEQTELVSDVLRAAAEVGEIADSRSSPGTARAIVAQLEGMVLFAKLANDPEMLHEVWAQAQLLLAVGVAAPITSR